MSDHEINLHNLHRRPFNPKSLLLSVIDELQPLLESKKLTVTCTTEDCTNEIITDSNVLHQIINSLLSYLVANISHGEIEIFMESNFYEPDNLLIMIDSKKWCISEKNLSKLLFNETFNLVRAKFLTKQLGGQIKAENGISKDATFVVMIPVGHLLTSDFLLNEDHTSIY